MNILKEHHISPDSNQTRVTYFGGKPMLLEFCGLAYAVSYPNSIILAENNFPVLEVYTHQLSNYLNEDEISILGLCNETLTGGLSGLTRGLAGRAGRALGYDTSGRSGTVAQQAGRQIKNIGRRTFDKARGVASELQQDFLTGSIIQNISNEVGKDLKQIVSNLKNNYNINMTPGKMSKLTEPQKIKVNIQGQPAELEVALYGAIEMSNKNQVLPPQGSNDQTQPIPRASIKLPNQDQTSPLPSRSGETTGPLPQTPRYSGPQIRF